MRWTFFPFSLFNRQPGSASSDQPTTYSPTEEYVSRLTDLPLPHVASIYRAGRPWPLSLDDFDRMAKCEAQALGCSLNDARQIVLKRLQWQKANAEAGGKPMDVAAYETWHRHRERVARRLKEDVAAVTKVHHGVLKYRWQEGKQPD